jgi:hypothetical protein
VAVLAPVAFFRAAEGKSPISNVTTTSKAAPHEDAAVDSADDAPPVAVISQTISLGVEDASPEALLETHFPATNGQFVGIVSLLSVCVSDGASLWLLQVLFCVHVRGSVMSVLGCLW